MSHAAANAAGVSRSAPLLRAAAWLLGSNVSSQALRLATNLLLTRLLAPEAFGLMAAASTVYFGLVMLSDLGVWQSVVQRTEAPDARFLGTAFSVQLLRGVLLAAIVLATAAMAAAASASGLAPAGSVYADPRLPWLMAGFALCALVQGAESMNLALAQRELRTRDLARLELASQVAGAAVAIVLAAASQAHTALLAGALASALARTALSHCLPGPATSASWEGAHARAIVAFGKWVLLSSLIGFAASQGERVILASLLDAGDFGRASIAFTLLAAASGILGTLNAHLVFPAFSAALRDRPAEADAFYLRAQRLADLLLGAAAGILAAAGAVLVGVLYDSRYEGAGRMLQILAPGLLAARFQVLEQMMFARGEPGWVTASNALRGIALAVLVPAGYRLAGIEGALCGVVASQFAGWPVALCFKQRARLPLLATEAWWPLALAAGWCIAAGAIRASTS